MRGIQQTILRDHTHLQRRGPWLVVARDRGQSLRFYKSTQSRVNSTIIRNFLKEEIWRESEPWNSGFAPGGNRQVSLYLLKHVETTDSVYREFIIHYFALGMKKMYDTIVRIPRFLLMVITGALGSLVMKLMHRPPPETANKPEPEPKPLPVKAIAPATPSTSPTKKGSGKTKKNGRK